MAFKLPAKAPISRYADTPDPDSTEVAVYDYMTSGRSALEAVCREKGLTWAVIGPYSSSALGTKARILVGTVYEVDSEGTLDACLTELSQSLLE